MTGTQVTTSLVAGVTVLLGGCWSEVAAPTVGAPPYLAVVATIVAPTIASAGNTFKYHVQELSGELGIDTVVSVAPRDTVVLSLAPATYTVELGGLPAQCRSREGRQRVLIAPKTNTTIVRYFVVCQSQLTISLYSDGAHLDSVFVYHLAAAGGVEHLGLIGGMDTLEFEGLPPGRTIFDLGDVAPNCAVTSDGGVHRIVTIDSSGGAHLAFVVHCSDPAHQPNIVAVHATYHDGVAGLVFRGGDPDRDIDRYFWDLTDCRRTSALPSGRLQLGGLRAGRTDNRDTITVLVAFDIGLPDSIVRNRCMALWLADSDGNLSEIIERPFAAGSAGSAPSASLFNARFLGVQALRTDVTAVDADGDFLGVFVKMQMRDGTLGAPNGSPDSRFFNFTGDLGSAIPDLGLYPPFTYDKYQAVIVYLLDAQGHATRLEDDDLFQ